MGIDASTWAYANQNPDGSWRVDYGGRDGYNIDTSKGGVEQFSSRDAAVARQYQIRQEAKSNDPYWQQNQGSGSSGSAADQVNNPGSPSSPWLNAARPLQATQADVLAFLASGANLASLVPDVPQVPGILQELIPQLTTDSAIIMQLQAARRVTPVPLRLRTFYSQRTDFAVRLTQLVQNHLQQVGANDAR